MTKREVAVFFSKIFGIYVILGALGALLSTYGNYSLRALIPQLKINDQSLIIVTLQSLALALLRLIFGILLIVKADFFAAKMITAGEAVIQGIDNRDLRKFVYRFVGLSFMLYAAIEIIRNSINYIQSPNLFPFLFLLITQAVQLIIGALLFFGFRAVVDFLKKFRAVGGGNE